MNGAERIAVERKRQIDEEGWSPKHDSSHNSGELCLLAALYLLADYTATTNTVEASDIIESELETYWGGGSVNYKEDKIKNLERAGALVAAEIDRLIANPTFDPMVNSSAK